MRGRLREVESLDQWRRVASLLKMRMRQLLAGWRRSSSSSAAWPPLAGTHRGIIVELAAEVDGRWRPLLRRDSDELYWLAMFADRQSCELMCRPGCLEHGWAELAPPIAADGGRVRIRMRPVMLADRAYDDEAGADDEPQTVVSR